MKVTVVIAILFCGIFVVSVGLGVVQILQEQAFLARAELDTGTVTGSQVDSSGNKVEFCPIIDFTTKAGEPVTYEGGDCVSHPNQIQIGQQVPVYYDPQNPKSFQTGRGSPLLQTVDRAGFPFIFGCLFLAIAVTMVAMSAGMAGLNRKQKAAYLARSQPQPLAELREQLRRDHVPAAESEARLAAEAEKLKAMQADILRQTEERRRQIGE